MSDTPRSDAECHSCTDTCSEWNGEWVPLEVCRQLERELTKQKGHTEAVMRTLKDALGIEDGRECLEQIGRMKEALSLVVPKCDYLHHPKRYQHKITEPCPVEELIRKAQKP